MQQLERQGKRGRGGVTRGGRRIPCEDPSGAGALPHGRASRQPNLGVFAAASLARVRRPTEFPACPTEFPHTLHCTTVACHTSCAQVQKASTLWLGNSSKRFSWKRCSVSQVLRICLRKSRRSSRCSDSVGCVILRLKPLTRRIFRPARRWAFSVARIPTSKQTTSSPPTRQVPKQKKQQEAIGKQLWDL